MKKKRAKKTTKKVVTAPANGLKAPSDPINIVIGAVIGAAVGALAGGLFAMNPEGVMASFNNASQHFKITPTDPAVAEHLDELKTEAAKGPPAPQVNVSVIKTSRGRKTRKNARKYAKQSA